MENEKKSKVWIMVGAPGGGKSTWAASKKDSLSDDVNIVSRDQIRFSLLSDKDSYFAKETLVYNTFVSEIIESAKTHKDTIVDATNINISSRRKLFNRLNPFIGGIVEYNAIVIMPPIEVCMQRNSTRTGRTRVPDSALKNIYSTYEEPIYEEGFTNIYRMKNN